MEMPILEVVLVYIHHQDLRALAPEFGADSQLEYPHTSRLYAGSLLQDFDLLIYVS